MGDESEEGRRGQIRGTLKSVKRRLWLDIIGRI